MFIIWNRTRSTNKQPKKKYTHNLSRPSRNTLNKTSHIRCCKKVELLLLSYGCVNISITDITRKCDSDLRVHVCHGYIGGNGRCYRCCTTHLSATTDDTSSTDCCSSRILTCPGEKCCHFTLLFKFRCTYTFLICMLQQTTVGQFSGVILG